MHVTFDPYTQSRAVFLDDSRESEPDFTRQNMGRQRECVYVGLCQVCARPVPWSRRNLIIAPMSVEWVSLEGRQVPVISEPWLDDRCTEIATRWCPALIRRRRDEDLTVVPVRSRREVQLVVSNGWIDGHLAEETRANPVVMWLKVALLTYRIVRANS
jgi:hypothetical protein